MPTSSRLLSCGPVRAIRVSTLLRAFALVLAGACVARAHAQLPVDNGVYKTRCNLLAASNDAIGNGAVSPALVSATHGVPAQQFLTFALDRSAENDHNVACSLFYLAAVAARNGNGGKPDADAAKSALALAQIELHTIQGQPLTFSEKLTQMKTKATQFTASSLTSAQLQAVVDAVSTVPLSMAPPSNQVAQNNKPRR